MQIQPYLNFNGNCKEAFEFYAQVLKGKIDMMMNHAGSPRSADCSGVARQDSPRPTHRRQCRPYGLRRSARGLSSRRAPSPSACRSMTSPRPSASSASYPPEADASSMPIQHTFWAARFGMFIDRYGIPWMINCEHPLPDTATHYSVIPSEVEDPAFRSHRSYAKAIHSLELERRTNAFPHGLSSRQHRCLRSGRPTQPRDDAQDGCTHTEKMSEGKLLSTEGCAPTVKGALVGLNKGKLSVLDGPFSEAKEIIGGFALFAAEVKAGGYRRSA